MDSRRQAKFSRLIQKELSDIFLRHSSRIFNRPFVGVSHIRATPDLGLVRVYLSLLTEKEPEKFIDLVRLHTSQIRALLASSIRNQVRKIPELEFFYDDTMDYVEKMDRIFAELKTPAESVEPEEGIAIKGEEI